MSHRARKGTSAAFRAACASSLVLMCALCGAFPADAQTGAAARQAAAGPASSAPAASRPAVDFNELLRLSEVYFAMRYLAPEETKRILGGSYDELFIRDLEKTENRYMVGTLHASKRQEIFVRGTANLKNAISDLEIVKQRSPVLGINLHRGFETLAMAVYRDITPHLLRGYELVLFGHSLGAAEATILALLLATDEWHVTRVYASGSPRVTDAAGSPVVARLPLTRIVNEGDPVPLLPPRRVVSPWDPYVDVGSAIILLDGPYYCIEDEQSEIEPLASDFWRALRANRIAGEVKDHLIPSYIQRIRSKTTEAIEVPVADMAAYIHR